MGKLFAEISMSLDGYVAGPDPSPEEPLGKGGEQLHEWVTRLKSWREAHGLSGGEDGVDSEVLEDNIARIEAVIMGRKMFSGGEGPWENDTNADGWWGDNPPFHVPVFVLTHHERETVQKEGGTTFTFVTDGIESALKQAKAAVTDRDIQIAGGAHVIQQYIKAGFVDELHLHLVPLVLGSGTRLFENMGDIKLEGVGTIASPTLLVTHYRFKILK